ncbi:MAG: YraN family protein [Woeseiaceae bacterium]|nr:YraN family protein [Woeseiaceae bacterium]
MVRPDRRTLGADAENLAFRFLTREGLTPVYRNFRCRCGEIDLIMQDRDCLVFIEVRYRASSRFARASLTVDIHKQRKLVRTAALFLSKRARYAESITRFDVVAIDGNEIEWIKDAFVSRDASL